MARITKVKTENYEEWKALRSRYIGGSDAAAVVGLNAYVSPYSLWAEKTGRAPGFEGNLATEVGTYMEEFVAQKFAEETGKKVRRANASFFNSDYPWAIANIDREIVGEDAGLEIKTTDSLNMKKFRDGEYPANYYVQCVHYLAVTGKKRWYLAVLIGHRDFKVFTIERDDAEIAALMKAECEFWKLVESNTPPALDGTQATQDTLKTMLSDSAPGRAIDLTGVSRHIELYLTLKEQVKKLQDQLYEHQAYIMNFMGDAESGAFDTTKVYFKTQSKQIFDRKAYEKDNGAIPNIYFNTSTSRPFKVVVRKS